MAKLRIYDGQVLFKRCAINLTLGIAAIIGYTGITAIDRVRDYLVNDYRIESVKTLIDENNYSAAQALLDDYSSAEKIDKRNQILLQQSLDSNKYSFEKANQKRELELFNDCSVV